jgi:GGDEF domain-containing protein
VTVGAEGSAYVARELVRRTRAGLPVDVALGLTHTDELAVLLPGCTADTAAGLLRTTVSTIGNVQLPGGAEVELRLAAGVAGYPEHAGDADELYMAADVALSDAVETAQAVAIAI